MKARRSRKHAEDLARPKTLRLYRIVLVLAISLCGCSRSSTDSPAPIETDVQPTTTEFTQGLLPESYLSKETALGIFAIAGDFSQLDGNQETIEFRCTITEGRYCWFTDEDLGGALYGTITKELSQAIIGEINAKTIEQARRNLIDVRCTRPLDSDWPIVCVGNWGWTEEWDPIEMK